MSEMEQPKWKNPECAMDCVDANDCDGSCARDEDIARFAPAEQSKPSLEDSPEYIAGRLAGLEEAAAFCEEEEILIDVKILNEQTKLQHGAYIARELSTRIRAMKESQR